MMVGPEENGRQKQQVKRRRSNSTKPCVAAGIGREFEKASIAPIEPSPERATACSESLGPFDHEIAPRHRCPSPASQALSPARSGLKNVGKSASTAPSATAARMC